MIWPVQTRSCQGWKRQHYWQTRRTTPTSECSSRWRQPIRHPRTYDKMRYEARHLIENFFCWIKQFRAIATRYDKTARNFLAAFHLVAAVCWLN